ncbi:Amidohydrolase-related domain-containing protein OS=Streptomyces antimycoticus OX=68175 GN=SANT12839_054380 PE=4 SV=1 [Streptomyces antimycoticus]
MPDAPSPRGADPRPAAAGRDRPVPHTTSGTRSCAWAPTGGITVLDRPRPPVLAPAGRAELAVFDADGACLATVVAGRLVHRCRRGGTPGPGRGAGRGR